MTDPRIEPQDRRYLVHAKAAKDPAIGWGDIKSAHGTLGEAISAAKATLQYGNSEAQVGDLVTGKVVFETASPPTI